ncbi:MAG: hypothetical protein IJ642_10370 [Oscillospiraceae bacterium]|nr:hypothetical protein [Oscillospiraceae bacterium]
MPIIANINTMGTAPDRFMKIANNNVQYVQFLNTVFQNGIDTGGSDHFMSSFSDIDNIANMYANGMPVPTVIGKIQQSPNVYRWLLAVMCAFIYGYDDQNALGVENVPFEQVQPTGAVVPIPNRSFLNIWKHKFDVPGGNDNDDPALPNQADNQHGVNLITFRTGHDYPDVLGCFSRRYFVIPLKEHNLTTYNPTKWKVKYNDLCSTAPTSLAEINSQLNIRQKVLLKLSANAIGAMVGVSQPLQLVQAVINHCISTDGIVLNGLAVPSIGKVCGIDFYKIQDTIDLDYLLSDRLFLGVENGSYHALYPMTDNLISGLVSGICSVQDMQLHVVPDAANPSTISSADITFNYSSEFVFVPNPLSGLTTVFKIPYAVPQKKEYPLSRIRCITGMHTLCMYPNLPVNYEDRCTQYTYLSCDESVIMRQPLPGIDSVNLETGVFMGVIDNTGVRKVIIDRKSDAPKNTVINNMTCNIYTKAAVKPEHFIEVCDQLASSCGYLLNMQLNNGQNIPALLTDGIPVQITFNAPQANTIEDMYAYVDFGSSSSCMKFKFGTSGNLSSTIVNDQCTLRMLLLDYAEADFTMLYRFILNHPAENTFVNFPSVSSVYNSTLGAEGDYYIYHTSFMPIVQTLSDYATANVDTNVSNKTQLAVPAGAAEVSPNIIINNLCYIIACNAVAKGCTTAYIVPSIPSKEYLGSLSSIWDSAIVNMQNVFPSLQMKNVLHTKDYRYLYESVAISNGIVGIAPNTLQVNIDIGDGTTDMAAIIVNSMSIRNICGYSSIEYAGKNLIKTVIKDIMNNAAKSTAEAVFKGRMGYGSSAFSPLSGHTAVERDTKATDLLNDFFDNETLRKKPRKTWENRVLDLLAASNMDAGIDQKIAANFTTRYLVMMPVIKDFIKTSIKIAGEHFVPGVTSIRIHFYGGSAKGIDLLDVIDGRYVNTRKLIETYFQKELQPNTTVDVPQGNAKHTLLDGLNALDITPLGNNQFQLAVSGASAPSSAAMAASNSIIPWELVNPNDATAFGEKGNPHQEAAEFRFVSIADAGDPVKAKLLNQAQLKNIQSYYADPEQCTEDLRRYFDEEIYGKLMNNQDAIQDVIEMVVIGFMDKASPALQQAARNEILHGVANNSFYRATNASIYPEMMKNAVFMFAVSELFSQFHRKLRTDHTIQNLDDIPGYEFGG